MLLMIDNYDSFTYNLVQYLGELGADIKVFRNDQVTVEEVRALAPDQIVISPGPGDPDDGGVSNEVIRQLGPSTPVLGVCLGHQCIGYVYGGKVSCRADARHGSISAGDMLTTSPTPGHAMVASDLPQAFGSVIGKALSPLPAGTGLVDVLITLQ